MVKNKKSKAPGAILFQIAPVVIAALAVSGFAYFDSSSILPRVFNLIALGLVLIVSGFIFGAYLPAKHSKSIGFTPTQISSFISLMFLTTGLFLFIGLTFKI